MSWVESNFETFQALECEGFQIDFDFESIFSIFQFWTNCSEFNVYMRAFQYSNILRAGVALCGRELSVIEWIFVLNAHNQSLTVPCSFAAMGNNKQNVNLNTLHHDDKTRDTRWIPFFLDPSPKHHKISFSQYILRIFFFPKHNIKSHTKTYRLICMRWHQARCQYHQQKHFTPHLDRLIWTFG